MIKKIIIGLLSVAGAFYIAMWVYTSFFLDCYSTQINAINSPDGKYEVRYMHKYCESKPNEIKIWLGHVGSNTSTLIFSSIATTTENIQLKWAGNNELHINYPEQLKPNTSLNAQVDNVYIEYNRVTAVPLTDK